MVLALPAGVLIVLLVGWQAALLTTAKARQPAVAAPVVPVIPFRKDPQGWIINSLRRKTGMNSWKDSFVCLNSRISGWALSRSMVASRSIREYLRSTNF